MEGKALIWFQKVEEAGHFINWGTFVEALLTRYPYHTLVLWRVLSSINQFHVWVHFEGLMTMKCNNQWIHGTLEKFAATIEAIFKKKKCLETPLRIQETTTQVSATFKSMIEEPSKKQESHNQFIEITKDERMEKLEGVTEEDLRTLESIDQVSKD